MSRDFLNDIPEQFRSIYDKAAEPNPMRTHFETLKKMEVVKDKIRETSVLYKELFQEQMFGFVTIDGALNLDIKVYNPSVLQETLSKEILTEFNRKVIIDSLGDDKVSVTFTPKDSNEEKTVHIRFSSADLVKAIEQNLEDADEAEEDLRKKYSKGFDCPDKTLYLNREDRNDIQGIERMLNSFNRADNPGNHSSDINKRQYFLNAMKAKPFRLTMARINWKQAIKSL